MEREIVIGVLYVFLELLVHDIRAVIHFLWKYSDRDVFC